MDMLKLMECFRDEENPDLSDCYFDDDNITTLSKEEILEKASSLNVDILKMCRLGMIYPEPENLCKLLYFAKRMASKNDTSVTAGTSKHQKTSDEVSGPSSKKAKKRNNNSKIIFRFILHAWYNFERTKLKPFIYI